MDRRKQLDLSVPISYSEEYKKFKCQLDNVEVLKEQLSVKNYKKRFHHLLCYEEEEHALQLALRCNKEYDVYIYPQNQRPEDIQSEDLKNYSTYGFITSDDGDSLSHAKQTSQGSFLIFDSVIIHAYHVSNSNPPPDAHFSAITIAFSKEEEMKIPQNNKFRVKIEFELKHSYFQMLHSFVDRLPHKVMKKLFPTQDNIISHLQKDNLMSHKRPSSYQFLDLDKDQMRALNLILNHPPESTPLLINGPYGTGKTRLLVRAAHDLLKRHKNKVMICAHHQASIDIFAEYFARMKEIYDPLGVCIIPNSSGFKTRQHLGDERLVITTLSAVSSLSDEKRFTDILIDEGGQVREPEIIGPLCLADENTRIVIAGDHLQVGPRLLVLGNKAQDNGLGLSLLERLHKIYDKMKPSTPHSVTLLNNYRCHKSILMLPSSLYYESALLSKVPDNVAHPRSPFPLNFVCSSLKDYDEAIPGMDELEAQAVLEEIQKYMEDWPEEWGEQDLSKVCIVSPSPEQCNIIRKKLKGIESIKDIEVLMTYNIQGREFKAIFISTCEATFADGKSKDVTKSLCNRYVFTTVITRSQSLVVAVGNPFLILNMEKHMIKEYGKEAQCWTPFIQQCIKCETFIYSEHSSKSVSDIVETKLILLDRVYSGSDCWQNKIDSILTAYKEVYDGLPVCKKAKSTLSESIDECYDEEVIHYEDTYTCTLRVYDGKTEAIPFDSKKRVVVIRNWGNRRGAFDGDTVTVGIFPDNPQNKCYGRVITAQRNGAVKLLCHVSADNPNDFFPIDNKNPMIRCCLLKRLYKTNEEDDQNILVFKEDSLKLDSKVIAVPQIKEIYKLSKAQRMIFLVRYIRWGKRKKNPLGIVIGAYRKGYTFSEAENLLKIQYGVHYNDNEPTAQNSCDYTMMRNDDFQSKPFTIDPEGAMNLDDAISVKRLTGGKPQEYLIGVHIINVAKHVARDSIEDKYAKSKFISVYGRKKGNKVMHMLPKEKRSQLSLRPGKLRDVISITCKITIDRDQPGKPILNDLEDTRIEQAQISSALQLTYENAHRLIVDDIPINNDQDSDLPLQEAIKVAYDIAVGMRRRRLHDSHAAHMYDYDKPEDMKCWKSPLLVKELMIWANSKVAEEIHSLYPDAAILRRQQPPNEKEIEEYVDESKNILHYSLCLSRYSKPKVPLSNSESLIIPFDIFGEIRKTLNDENITLLISLLSSDRLYPQLAGAHSKICPKFQPAEYCSTERDQTDASAYRHHSLCLDKYTHFTSPLRRYIDLQVQRILLESLKEVSQRFEFSHEEHLELCTLANERSKNSSNFEKEIEKLELADMLKSNSQVYSASISMVQKGIIKLVFHHLEFKSLCNTEEMRLKISNLSANREMDHYYQWTVRITSLKKDLVASLLQSPPLPISKYKGSIDETSDTFIKVYSNSILKRHKLFAYTLKASQQSLFIEVPSEVWVKIHEFINDPDKINMDEIKHILQQISLPPSPTKVDSLTPDINSPFMDCYIKVPLKESSILRVWLTGSFRRHSISPAIQLVKISPLLFICVQHNTYPAEYFSDISLAQASKVNYCNLTGYIDLWKKVLLAEAAENTIKECQPMIKVIHDVHLNWTNFEATRSGMGYVCRAPIKMVLSERFVSQCNEFFKITKGDLLCVRYGCDPHHSQRAVFHFVVHNIEGESPKTVSMEPVGHNIMNRYVSKAMKEVLQSRDSTCQVQVIPLTTSYRRVFGGLLALIDEGSSQLSQAVAVNRPDLQAIQDLDVHYRQSIQTVIANDVCVQSISEWSQTTPNSKVMNASNSKVLNAHQKEAMSKALKTRFQQIQGPPGTGKSETGAHIAYALAKSNRNLHNSGCVLYCGPSNKSVDVVFEKFHHLLSSDKGKDKDLSILRIYSRAVERNDYSGPNSGDDQISTTHCPEWAKAYSLHHMIRDEKRSDQIFKNVRNLDDEFKSTKKRGEIASGVLCNEYRKVVMRAEEEIFKKGKFDVVLCTCNEASGIRVRKNLSPRQCIIDECGMAYEPETIVPISLCEHAVLIGDHKQLQPVIKYQRAKECGLSTSLFERYAENYGERYTYTLKIQYRMHEAICAFPSKHFYGNQLETDDSIKNRTNHEAKLDGFWPQKNCPIVFVNTVGTEEEDLTGRREGADKIGIESKFNQEEINKVVEIARVLHKRHKVELEQMAVLTPYSAQRSKIREKLTGRLKGLKVSSITESQGNEYGIVILSTVRSQPIEEIKNPHYVWADSKWRRENLGFITDPHQINVGITRSKYGLIIIGNKMLLKYDPNTWYHLLKHYEEKKCVVDSAHFPIKVSL